MIKIAIVDDNIQLTEILKKYLSSLDDMEVMGVAYNGIEGMGLLKREQPDLVILDLIMPYSDGLSLLKNLDKEKMVTNVLILTSIGNEDIIKKASEFGARYFMLKPVELSHLSNTIRNICPNQKGSYIVKTNTEKKEFLHNNKGQNIENRITNVLRLMGIPANLKGYFYLREAIQMVFSNFELLMGWGGITKVIYPTIASKYHTTPSRVERGIRHSIEVGWNRSSNEVLELIFGNTVNTFKVKPTNGKFIAMITNYLRIQKDC
ncbi:sporulation transcription factor Spo0A [Paenibacillus sp. BSR1-1]|uniref:sporulation transcription factor Spo0A n=1 Tax=Paenibacillus sp. BSR1-1 TaxID=3020845 RepID=UPI0025AFE745|nr:sporulation transcription factor Spo0A [Paenibacillus sp. BSR1-1]MDN3015464.1 sporulation transcription factor Spo0A [Paenibacillus sp. BSR1-1]